MSQVFSFAAADGMGADVLGGKGAGLAAMAGQGLNVPPGFVVTTEACNRSRRLGSIANDLRAEVFEELSCIELARGRRLGDPDMPLLIAVRSGAPVSMPGMMDTVLNLGINDTTRVALGREFGEDFAWDSYRRFLECFGVVVLHLDQAHFTRAQERKGAGGEVLVRAFEEVIAEHYGELPTDPKIHLMMAIDAVFRSWDNPRAEVYRRLEGIDDAMGTAVVVQSMVFGNLNSRSGTGVVFTRDPNTGEDIPYGDFLFSAQGEDVVSGRHQTLPITSIADALPEVWVSLTHTLQRLEEWRDDMLDIEFTIEDGELFFLQVRSAKRSAIAAVRTVVSLVDANRITRAQALARITPEQLDVLSRPHLSELHDAPFLAYGLAASPGVAIGAICLTTERVLDTADTGEPAILVRDETSPDDIHGMSMSEGIVTAKGGLVSHAAVVARSLAVPAVVGVKDMRIDHEVGIVRFGDVTVAEGEVITIDGGSGVVARDALPVEPPAETVEVERFLSWADEIAQPVLPNTVPSMRLAAAHRKLQAEVCVPN